MKEGKKEYMENGVNPPKKKEDVTVEVDTIREEMPPDLKKKLFPDDEPDSCQNMSTETKKGLRESS